MCIICQDEHKGHTISDLGEVLIKNDDLLNAMKELSQTMDNFKYKFNIIKEVLNKLMNQLLIIII